MSQQLVQAYVDAFLAGQRFSTIVEARRFAELTLGQSVVPGTAIVKQIDEIIEAAVVRAAGVVIQNSHTTHEAYDRLTDLLERQPNLSVRSSTSVLQQAYSTPIPIAYLASVLANITPETTVYEPTAGNGALLIAANPEKVTANEINGNRFSELATKGYSKLTQQNSTVYQPQEQVNRVLCNPPFGSVLDENHRTQRFRIADTWTTQIDQVIALKALEAMKDNGRAVLILGGKLGSDAAVRSDRYNTRESRAFFYVLYSQYNVTQHFSIWGDLYRKQGAGFPIDVIVIEGRGKSQCLLPAAEVPVIYKSFANSRRYCLMNPYENYPYLWTPPMMPSLFLVKVPEAIATLDEQIYKILMQARVTWMIQRWIEETEDSPIATQTLLATKLSEVEPLLDYPLLDKESITLSEWQEAWSETLILRSQVFIGAMSLLGVKLSAEIMRKSHPEFQDFLSLHQAVYLEEWLNDLTSYA